MIMNVEEWINQNKSEERTLSYVFIAYTAEQFQGSEDLMALHQIADAAARNAGAMAYWVGCSCMPEPDQMQEDVSVVLAWSCIRSHSLGLSNL